MSPGDSGIYNFELFLDHQFPFQPPQVRSLTAFCQPPLNDGRDFFDDIVKEDGWQIARKLAAIVKLLPGFIRQIKSAPTRVWGTFHTGHVYNLEQ